MMRAVRIHCFRQAVLVKLRNFCGTVLYQPDEETFYRVSRKCQFRSTVVAGWRKDEDKEWQVTVGDGAAAVTEMD